MSGKQREIKCIQSCIYSHCKSFSGSWRRKFSQWDWQSITSRWSSKFYISFNTFLFINFHNECYQIHTPQGKIIVMIVINLLWSISYIPMCWIKGNCSKHVCSICNEKLNHWMPCSWLNLRELISEFCMF